MRNIWKTFKQGARMGHSVFSINPFNLADAKKELFALAQTTSIVNSFVDMFKKFIKF